MTRHESTRTRKATAGRPAFTLLELVVVLLVLGILAAIAVPSFQRVKENSVKRAAQTTLEAAARNGEAIARSDRSATDEAIATAVAGEFTEKDGLTVSVGSGADADTVTVTQTSGSITASGSVEFVDGAAVTTPVTVGGGSGGGSSSTSSSTTTVPAFVPTVGATGPGGGTIIAVFETPFACGPTLAATCTYLEMAAANWQQHPSIGSSETGDPARSWSGDTGTSVGETNNDLGHGYRNTETIVLADGTADRAGTLARAYNGGGLTDWFLPSGDELNELCKYALQQTTGDVTVSCVASGSLRPGFTAASYWSSAETSATLAWTRSLTNGAPSNVATKAGTHRVRPVRAG